MAPMRDVSIINCRGYTFVIGIMTYKLVHEHEREVKRYKFADERQFTNYSTRTNGKNERERELI